VFDVKERIYFKAWEKALTSAVLLVGRDAPIHSESRLSTATGPQCQRSTTAGSRCCMRTTREAVAAEAEPSVRLRRSDWGRWLNQVELGSYKFLCFLPGLDPLQIAADANGLQLSVLPRCIDPGNMA